MNTKRVALLLIVVVIAVGVAAYVRKRPAGDTGVIRVSGNIEITTAEVSFKLPGRVIERLVDEGDIVKAGQVVARLDSADLEQEAALQRAAVAASEAALAELLAGSRPEEIEQAEATVRRTQVEEGNAKIEFDRQTKLLDGGATTQQQLDTARRIYNAATAVRQESEAALKLVREGPRKERIELARAQLEQARAALALAQTRLGYAVVNSPLPGVVLSKNIEPGEFVAAGTPVVTVGDVANTWLRAYVNETDLGRVKIGQQVEVTADTWLGRVYEGRISFISSEAEFTPKIIQTEKERVKLVYRIKIVIGNPNMELKPGMPADGTIRVGAGPG